MLRNGENKLNLIAIKTKNILYISDNYKNESYFHSILQDFIIDGEKPKSTYNKDWFEVEKLPKKIERIVPPQRINQRYELRDGFPESEMTPKIINKAYIDEDDEYYEVKGLYELKYDKTEETYEEVPFEVAIVEEIDQEFEIKQQPFELKYNLLDRIQTHPVLLPTKPCTLTKEQTYRIIKNHVKTHIDPKYAEVTSDYDFCFTVEKRIQHDPESYQVDVNAFNKRRKPKYETRYRRARKVKIYECAPKPYQSYPVVEPFHGKNADDLQKNIDEFLNKLMAKINEPLVECEHCNGMGVILDATN